MDSRCGCPCRSSTGDAAALQDLLYNELLLKELLVRSSFSGTKTVPMQRLQRGLLEAFKRRPHRLGIFSQTVLALRGSYFVRL